MDITKDVLTIVTVIILDHLLEKLHLIITYVLVNLVLLVVLVILVIH